MMERTSDQKDREGNVKISTAHLLIIFCEDNEVAIKDDSESYLRK